MHEQFPGYRALEDIRAFPVERWRDITYSAVDDWLIKRFLPRRGLAAIYGKPGAFKSFVALFIALSVALGYDFAGRRTMKGAVTYVAAEGSAGLRKRGAGYLKSWPDLPADVDFALIPAAPNFGSEPSDLAALIASIEIAGIKPVLIVIDTVAKTIGAADENGAGMTAFVRNAGALAAHFDCLVLAVHHVGLNEDAQKRMRGHSSLHGALDAQLLCERREGENTATLTVQKLKDDVSDMILTAHLSRVIVGYDEDGDEASTLIVERVTEGFPTSAEPKVKSVPARQRLLSEKVREAISEAGEELKLLGGEGPAIRCIFDEVVRDRYYAAIAEMAEPGADLKRLGERQRKSFNESIKGLLDAKSLCARPVGGRRMLWLP